VSETTVPLLNTPPHKFFGFAAYTGIPRVRLVGSVNAESERSVQDDAGVLWSLAGYSTVGAKAVFAVHRTLDVEVSGTNVFDRQYELSSGFPEAGRVALVQLRFRY
jgi:iron complex outermembrane receptor protein